MSLIGLKQDGEKVALGQARVDAMLRVVLERLG